MLGMWRIHFNSKFTFIFSKKFIIFAKKLQYQLFQDKNDVDNE